MVHPSHSQTGRAESQTETPVALSVAHGCSILPAKLETEQQSAMVYRLSLISQEEMVAGMTATVVE